jgi:hypothetical protein
VREVSGARRLSLPYHKIDWDLVYEFRRVQGRVRELEKQVAELQRLVSATLATCDG